MPPDIRFASAINYNAPSPVGVGDTVDIDWTEQNHGTPSAAYTSFVQVTWNPDGGGNPSTWSTTVQCTPLAGGANAVRTASFTPSLLVDGPPPDVMDITIEVWVDNQAQPPTVPGQNYDQIQSSLM
jgi:hypothetical protein